MRWPALPVLTCFKLEVHQRQMSLEVLVAAFSLLKTCSRPGTLVPFKRDSQRSDFEITFRSNNETTHSYHSYHSLTFKIWIGPWRPGNQLRGVQKVVSCILGCWTPLAWFNGRMFVFCMSMCRLQFFHGFAIWFQACTLAEQPFWMTECGSIIGILHWIYVDDLTIWNKLKIILLRSTFDLRFHRGAIGFDWESQVHARSVSCSLKLAFCSWWLHPLHGVRQVAVYRYMYCMTRESENIPYSIHKLLGSTEIVMKLYVFSCHVLPHFGF